MILASNGIISVSRGIAVSDADAQAFINTAVIIDITQANAINTLVISLKSANIWTKMKAIYPFVGGTASQHRFNLKDPRPVAGAFYLDFFGGGTHSSTGYQANGGTAYADTKLTEATTLNSNDTHISFYSRTNNSGGAQCDIGAADNTTQSNIFSNFSGTFYPRIQASNSGFAVSLDTRGLFIANRVNATQVQGWRNTTKYIINSNSTGKTTVPFWIADLNLNNTSGVVRSQKEYAFVTIGDGLTDAEAGAFYTAVQAYQTALSRQV